MQNETPPTPPSQGGVFCSPPLARAGARFNTAPIQEKGVLNGDIKISSLDRARTREIEAAVNDAVALEYPHLLKKAVEPFKASRGLGRPRFQTASDLSARPNLRLIVRRSAMELLAQKFCGTPPTGLIAINKTRFFC